MRDFIDLVEKLSRHATQVPDHIGQAFPKSEITQPHLYHGTNLDNVLMIVKDNDISPGANWRGEGERVSLTTNYETAHEFGTYGEFNDFPAVIVLDWAKLAKNFEIHPYRDTNLHGEELPTEYEQAVYGTIKPLSKYLVSVNVDLTVIKAAIDDEQYYQWINHEKGWFANRKHFQRVLTKLSSAPFFNRVAR